jgi:hypothetical protein
MNDRMLIGFLRFVAVLQIATGGVTIVPTAWLAAWHAWVGLGPLPDSAMLQYTVRGGGFVQLCIGALIWVIASDVVRYRPLVILVGAIYASAGPAFWFIDALSGLPTFWCLLDSLSCLAVGGIVLALCFRGRHHAASTLLAAEGKAI